MDQQEPQVGAPINPPINQPSQGKMQQSGFGQQPGFGQQQGFGQQMYSQQPLNLRPPPILGCPIGLEPLILTDHIFIQQEIDCLEVMIGFEQSNRYNIMDMFGQRIFFAAEQSNCCARMFCKEKRGFTISVLNWAREVVLKITRDYCILCGDEVKVFYQGMEYIGRVVSNCGCCRIRPKLKIIDANGNVVLRIIGPCSCVCTLCQDIVFNVFLEDGVTSVGQVIKHWSGIGKEFYTSADNFGINFHPNLDVKIKAVLIGAVFLIDFLYFENSKERR